jgi:methylenetetrahydrofolate reductase (NADPH)
LDFHHQAGFGRAEGDAAAVCAEQMIDLIDHGVEELHFCTMNRADLVFAICHLIGLRAKPKVAAEAA